MDDHKSIKYDYWFLFNHCVKELKISPDVFWRMDIVEMAQLLHVEQKNDIDTSIMLNYERQQNGASKEWLQKNY